MNEITISYHLLIALLIASFLLGLVIMNKTKLCKNGKWSLAWVAIIVFLWTYVFIVGAAIFSDILAQWNLNKLDLNQDGIFSGSEITPEQKDAMKKVTSDTGRNLSFVTGLVFSTLVALLVYVVGSFIGFYRSRNNNVLKS